MDVDHDPLLLLPGLAQLLEEILAVVRLDVNVPTLDLGQKQLFAWI